MSEALIILCTCPDDTTAERLARGLVTERLSACVNVLPGIRSIYRWQSAVEDEAEVLLVIKSTGDAYAALESWLTRHHPYDVPEIVSLPTSHVAAPYLAWLRGNVEADASA
jgi:periplasmic divalent cation tolerance protein